MTPPTKCSDGFCVVVERDGDRWYVHDSKDPTGPRLVYTTDEFVRICHQTIVNTTRQPDCVVTVRDTHVWVGFTADGEDARLRFTRGEMAAFRAGVLAGEFRLPAALEHQTQGAC